MMDEEAAQMMKTKNHPHVRRESTGKAGERFTCEGCGASSTIPQFWLYVWKDKKLVKRVDELLTQSLIYRAHFQRRVKPATTESENV